jgi:two-component system CheB/CheR fusion protein
VQGLVQQAMTHARDLAHDLATLDLKGDDLPAAFDGLAKHAAELFKISCQFEAEGSLPPLESNIASQLYKIAQEAVTNAIKHAKASRVGISLANGSDAGHARHLHGAAGGEEGVGSSALSVEAGGLPSGFASSWRD